MDDEIEIPKIGFARKLARSLLKQAKINDYPVKILDVSKIIPELSITGVELEDEISGMEATYKGMCFIRYNSSQPVKRNRFTVAHELGHAMLGHADQCIKGKIGSKSPMEVEADQFAAELLMPLEMLKKSMGSITELGQLARAFWVSKDAMMWRVMETKQYGHLTSWN